MSDGPDDRAEEDADTAAGDDEDDRTRPDDAGADGRRGRRGDEPLADLAERARARRSPPEGDVGGEVGAEEAEADPLAALERAVEEDDAGGTGPAGGEDPFEQVEVGDIDEEEVWESIDDEGATPDEPSIGAGVDAERVERDDPGAKRPDHVVDKGSYCQRCRFFSAPPDVRCTHDGTEVVEVVDSERFRVRGCPMVSRGEAVDRPSDADDGD